MKLLPSLDCRLQTERTAGEIGVILKSVTISGNRSFTASRQGEFTGNIDDTEFRLVSNSRNRNSFLPVIKGKLLTNGNKTEICIRMRMHPLDAEGFCSALPVLGSTAFMMTFAQILMRVCFYLPAKKSMQRIKELLETADR